MSLRYRLALLISALVPSVPAVAGGVRIVEPTGSQNFATIGAAVAAAAEGDVILVGAGSYPGFSVAGKSVSICAVPGAGFTVQGTISVSALTQDQTVVLSGVHIALPADSGNTPPLSITNCDGHVRVERSSFKASDYLTWFCGFLAPGEPGVRVTASPRVAFQGCTFTGGRGEGLDPNELATCAPAGNGGAGLAASGSTIAIYDCTSTGGQGGGSEGTQGIGGAGVALSGSTLLASNALFVGGRGGQNFFAAPVGVGGRGGDGATFAGGSVLYEVGCTFQGGPGGFGGGGVGPAGAPYGGGTPTALAGPARSASVTPTVQVDLASWSISFAGSPGEQVNLLTSLDPAFALSPVAHGVWLVRRAMLFAINALGMTDGTGGLATTLATGDLPAGSLVHKRYVQVAIRSSGLIWLGSQAALVLLDRDSGPDCNANGVSDFVDVVLGTVADANDNLIPDSCPGG